jgi:hypothetical protein
VGLGLLSAGSTDAINLSAAAAGAAAGLFLAFSSTPVPFKGGTLQAFPFVGPLLAVTDAAGAISLPFVVPAGMPAGTELWLQWGVQDAGAVHGVALSNAIEGLVP